MKKFLLGVAAVAVCGTAAAFAGGHDCCAVGQAKQTNANMSCVSFANLNLNAEQKTKLEAAQSSCTKAGCTKESQAKFLAQAKTILNAEQYAALKKECGSAHKGKAG